MRDALEARSGLSPEQIDTLCAFGQALIEKNKVMNLTAITEPQAVAELHFLDCIALLRAEDFSGKRVIDIGCGAGFPGVPLKIAEPSIELTLLDSLAKRMTWLREILPQLGVEAEVVTARAEEFVQTRREQYDIATSRAVARLNILSELCLPYVKVGGAFLAMKGALAGEEMEEAKRAVALLGGMIYLCTDINKKGALYCAVWSLLIAQCAYESWCFLELQFTRYGHPLNMASPWAVLVQLLSGAVFFAAVYILLARQLPYKGEYHIGPRQLFSAFFIGILFMVQAAVLDNARAEQTPLSLTVTILIGQFYFITLLYFQSELFKKSAMEKEMNELNLLYERQRQQYQVARQNVQIINKRCHELKVQIANLRKLSPEAVPQERIDEAERAARLYDANRNTGNEVLDVVLTEKSLLCESRGIQLNAVANGSCLGFFEAGDLYALFANALDHAVESAVQVSRPECRVIDLLVCVRQGFVVVNIISPLRPPEQQASRSAQYELKVIRRIVQKYKGTLTLEEQGEFFAEKIIFPLQK